MISYYTTSTFCPRWRCLHYTIQECKLHWQCYYPIISSRKWAQTFQVHRCIFWWKEGWLIGRNDRGRVCRRTIPVLRRGPRWCPNALGCFALGWSTHKAQCNAETRGSSYTWSCSPWGRPLSPDSLYQPPPSSLSRDVLSHLRFFWTLIIAVPQYHWHPHPYPS